MGEDFPGVRQGSLQALCHVAADGNECVAASQPECEPGNVHRYRVIVPVCLRFLRICGSLPYSDYGPMMLEAQT